MLKESIVLGAGCFWCLDAGLRLIKGVLEVKSGYAGGHSDNPNYYTVANGDTGHAEVVEVTFDSNVLSLKDVLDLFWAMHNPTTLNYQGNDRGTEYRSIILYEDENQLPIIEKSIADVSKLWDDPIVTEVKKLEKFYLAEEEHQDFFNKYPEQAYCQVIINPKLKKLKEKFADRIKSA